MYDVYASVARLATECKKIFAQPLGSQRANSTILSTLQESLTRNGRTIPNRDLGAHRTALCRCGNRRNVKLEP